MAATNLFKWNGTEFVPSGVWFCTKCNLVHQDEGMAERCCEPTNCDTCGRELPAKEFRLRCHECQSKLIIERFEEKIANAEEVDTFEGMLFHESLSGHSDGYFNDESELLDYCSDEGIAPPEFALCCKPSVFCVDPQRVIEQAMEDCEITSCEDYDPALDGVEEFAQACEKFSEANRDVRVWFPDYSRKVRLVPVEREVQGG